MTSPTNAPHTRVPGRPRRVGLYGPFAALAIALLGWGGAWLWVKGGIERDLDTTAAQVKAAGGAFTWSRRRVSGYPFRFDVDFDGLAWRGPDGWGVLVPELRSETSFFAFGHWVAYAPAGVKLLRPTGGPVRIEAQALRASVSDIGNRPPTISLEGQGLTFTPLVGARPYVLASAGQLHIHTHAGPANQGAFLIEVDEAKASSAGKLAAVSGGGAVTLEAEAIYDHASAMAGLGWSPALRSWVATGGKLHVRHLHFQAGPIEIDGRGSGLTLDLDGRLLGDLYLTRGGPELALLSSSGAPRTRPSAGGDAGVLSLQAGHMTLGPLTVGRSPKVY